MLESVAEAKFVLKVVSDCLTIPLKNIFDSFGPSNRGNTASAKKNKLKNSSIAAILDGMAIEIVHIGSDLINAAIKPNIAIFIAKRGGTFESAALTQSSWSCRIFSALSIFTLSPMTFNITSSLTEN